MNGRQAST